MCRSHILLSARGDLCLTVEYIKAEDYDDDDVDYDECFEPPNQLIINVISKSRVLSNLDDRQRPNFHYILTIASQSLLISQYAVR